MVSVVSVFVLAAALALCAVASASAEPSCACPANYLPVCGEDAVTYSNKCQAACAGMNVVHDGECGLAQRRRDLREAAQQQQVQQVQQQVHDCTCTKEFAPVCGVNGQTYGNACLAGCAGVPVDHEGMCDKPAAAVIPGRQQETQPRDGEEHEPCICVALWAPVCGEDGKTYGNSCQAKCAGVSVASQGQCQGSAAQRRALPENMGLM